MYNSPLFEKFIPRQSAFLLFSVPSRLTQFSAVVLHLGTRKIIGSPPAYKIVIVYEFYHHFYSLIYSLVKLI